MAAGSHRFSPYRVQSLDRAFDILECLAANGPELALAEITSSVGLSKSTVHRILCALENRAYVSQGIPTRKYRLGVKLFELGLKAVDDGGILAVAHPRLTELVSDTGETAHLGVLRDGQVLSLCAVESPQTLRTPSTVGRRSPAHSSSQGKVMLAFASSEELELVLSTHGLPRFTAKTIADPDTLRAELDRVRAQGYAIDDEEFERGLKCIGAPVLDGAGRVKAAVSIAGPANRLGKKEMPALVEAVRRTAGVLSTDLSRVGRHGDDGLEAGVRKG